MATSIKSTDLNAKTYQSISVLKRQLKGYVDTVANYNGTGPNGWAGVTIKPNQITGRGLDLAIPNAGTAAQQAAIRDAITYGASKGVTVNPIIIP